MNGKHIDLIQRIKKAVGQHPLEWIGIIKTGLSTAKFRYLLRCADSGCIVGYQTQILNFSNVKIGKDTLILDNVYMRAGATGSIDIGDNVAINSFAKLFGHGGISVADNAQIGPGALITTTTHDPNKYMEVEFHPIFIREWAWIGANATVLSGVTIGKHAVIGAGSVVTKNIPDYSIAVGAPARVIGEVSPPEST